MAKYKLSFQTAAWTSIEVEAESLDEAIDAAWQKEFPSLCAQCSGWGGDTDLELGDEWEPDENYYTVDGEQVIVPKEATP